MKSFEIPDYFDTYCIYPFDGTISAHVLLSEIPNKEFIYFITNESKVITISLYRDDPLEDEVDIIDSDWYLINNCIYGLGGYRAICDKLQELYNNFIFGDWGNEFSPDYKSLGKDNIRKVDKTIINVNDIFSMTDGYPLENGIHQFGILFVWHRVNFVKGLEILQFGFEHPISRWSVWVSLNADMILDWTDEVKLNMSDDWYNEEDAKFLTSPLPDQYRMSINQYIQSRGMDFIFNKIQENYNMIIFKDGDDSFLKYSKDHCRDCIIHEISGV